MKVYKTLQINIVLTKTDRAKNLENLHLDATKNTTMKNIGKLQENFNMNMCCMNFEIKFGFTYCDTTTKTSDTCIYINN